MFFVTCVAASSLKCLLRVKGFLRGFIFVEYFWVVKFGTNVLVLMVQVIFARHAVSSPPPAYFPFTKRRKSEFKALRKSLEEVSAKKEEAIKEAINEMEARYQRKRKLIMFGIDEKQLKVELFVREKILTETSFTDSIWNRFVWFADLSFHGLRRIGKAQQSRTRLIRITWKIENELDQLLRWLYQYWPFINAAKTAWD